jgi:signal transduction histidine kinase
VILPAIFVVTLAGAAWWVSPESALALSGVFALIYGLVVHNERSLDAQRDRIEKKLKKRNRQRSKYTKKLKRLTRQQSEIISAIGHEFKNPVSAIAGYAQTVYDDPDLPLHLRQKFLEKVIRNTRRISEMIDRLTLAITFDNQTLRPTEELFDMALLVEEVVDNLRQKYPDRTLHIETVSVEVRGDRMLFWHAVVNLIDNALKYSEAAVTIRLTPDRFDVVDRGIGIAPEKIDKITKRFYRADTRSWNNSMGVGLFIVEYVLRLHATRLEIESVPGEGSTFGFVLPKAHE